MQSDSEIVKALREKIMALGSAALSDEELLSLIIRTGDDMKDVITLSEFILKRSGSLFELSKEDVAELERKNKGLSENKIASIMASFEIGKRALQRPIHKINFTDSENVAAFMMPRLSGELQEHFCVLLLDVKNNLISVEDISVGTLNTSVVHIRDVFRCAIKKNANSIIAVHNHPGGSITPSRADIHLTEDIKKASEIIDIKFLDHIIVASGGYYSFKNHREL